MAKRVALYGAGLTGRATAELIGARNDIEVEFVVDSAPSMWGKTLSPGLTVESPEVLRNYKGEILVTCAGGLQLRRKLEQEFGLAPNYEWAWKVAQARLTKHWSRRIEEIRAIRTGLQDQESRTLLDFVTAIKPRSNHEILSMGVEASYFSPDFVSPKIGGTLVVGGASEGQEIDHLRGCSGNFSRILMVEPSFSAMDVLANRVATSSFSEKVTLINSGLGALGGQTALTEAGVSTRTQQQSRSLSKIDGPLTKIVTIDSLQLSHPPVSLITLDVEGDEILALEGARTTIANCLPIVAVSAYHNPEDLFDLWGFFISTGVKWKFYLRALDFGLNDLTLFAVPADF